MRADLLPSPSIGARGLQLRTASAQAISQVQIAAAAYSDGKHPDAGWLRTFFDACSAAMEQLGAAPTAQSVNLVGLGDSRVPTFLDKGTNRQKGGGDPLNNLCALSMQRYRVIADFGKSGQTPEQFLTQLPDLLALTPGVVWMPSALNALGQDIPTATTSGTDSASRMQAAAITLRNAGWIVVLGSEVGQVGLTAGRRAQVDLYNASLQAFAARQKNIVFLDLRPEFCDANGVVRNEFTYDGTHWSQFGAWRVALAMKPLFDMLMPGTATFELNASGVPQIGGYTNLLPNALFATVTGGSTATGATGTFAGACKFNKTGTGAALAVQSTAGRVRMNWTFGAQNDNVRMSQEMTGWNSGDRVRGMALVTVNGTPTGLAGVGLTMLAYYDATSTTYADMSSNATWAGPNGTFRMLLLTQEYVLPTSSNRAALAVTVQATAFSAGTGEMDITQIGALRAV